MDHATASERTTSFAEIDAWECSRFRSSQTVRHWLVLRALDRHRAGDYVPDACNLTVAFHRLIDGVRAGRIGLDFRPDRLAVFQLPSRHEPLFLQAMVYWCAQMKCSMELMAEAHAVLGSSAPLRDLFAVVGRIERSRPPGRPSDAPLSRRTRLAQVRPTVLTLPLRWA